MLVGYASNCRLDSKCPECTCFVQSLRLPIDDMAFYDGHEKCTLDDGAVIAYWILGSENLGKKRPLILINGMSSRMGDWENLTHELQKKRPSEFTFPNIVLGF
jgi:hypothetical protein